MRAAATDQNAGRIEIRIDRLDFEGETLFESFSLSLAQGRWTVLLGSSGCGKTTLLRVVAGLTAQGGATDHEGRALTGQIAYMAQDDLLLPWLSVLENALLGFRLRGADQAAMARAREQALLVLEEVGLFDARDALPSELSGGMRQRAALARTLVEDRPVVLMDEPFSAVDAIQRHRLQDLAARLLDRRTILLVTHSPREALRLGHELIVLGDRPARVIDRLSLGGDIARNLAASDLAAAEEQLLRTLAGDHDKAQAA